jgi:hypothetical protein
VKKVPIRHSSKKSLGFNSEATLLRVCRDTLNILQGAGLLVYRRIHSTGIPNGKGRFRPNEDMQGMPDLLIWLKSGPVLAIELKSSVGKTTESQDLFRDAIERMGHPYHIVNSISLLERLLASHGVVHWVVKQ